MTDIDNVVYFVVDGEMHSARILGRLDIDIEVDSESKHLTPNEVAQKILINVESDSLSHRESNNLVAISKRPGRWYYLSGSSVVHSDDCHRTKEAAADAYRNYLMGG